MGHSRAQKALSHERILGAAADQLRCGGLAAICINDLMDSVGLTHGGFYSHFRSREDLLAQAVGRAFDDAGARLRHHAESQPSQPVVGLIRGYLTIYHCDHPAEGCPVPALLGEIGAAPPQVRAAFRARFGAFVTWVAALTRADDVRRARSQATAIVCAMAGAIAIARILEDTSAVGLLLESVTDYCIGLADRHLASDSARETAV